MKYLKSRTLWTAVAIVLINGIPPLKDLIPVTWLPIVDSALGLLAIYFRVNPRV
jgi:hypothetical protein